jgi:hypothetical protein
MGAVAVPLNLNVLGDTAAPVEVPVRNARQLKAVVKIVSPTIFDSYLSSERVTLMVTSGAIVLLSPDVGRSG